MIVLGLLLMAGCAALAVDAVVQNGHLAAATAFNQPITHLSLGAIFIAGTVLGLLFALGLVMLTGGIGRAGRRRRQRRVAASEAQAEATALREHNERLAAELEARNIADDDVYPAEGQTVETPTSANGGRHRA
ncbi:MAG TPA: hypothetical protein VFH54_02835 [Mycobacteriales bacterium]|nr:hypothetical protein [Mycobacteriales bacterium]